MWIISRHVKVDAAERDAWVAAHRDLIRRARQAPGFRKIEPSATRTLAATETRGRGKAARTAIAASPAQNANTADVPGA